MLCLNQTDDKFNLVILKAVAFIVACLRTLASLKHVSVTLFNFIPVPESTELSLPDRVIWELKPFGIRSAKMVQVRCSSQGESYLQI